MLSREVLKNIRRIHLHARFLVRDAMMGEYRSSFKGQGMEFDEVREYAPGDDVRHIDWNVTARTQITHVKKFREERELTVFLAVDMSASGDFGSRERFKREMAAEIAAALAYIAVQNNDKVGVILFSEKIEKYIVPQKGRNHVLRVIREVLAFEPSHRGTDFVGMLQFLSRVARRRSVVFVISDFVADGYEKMLRTIGLKHDVVALTLHDPLEDVLPNVGLLALRDAETGHSVVVDTASAEVRAHYQHLAREKEEALANILRRSRVERIPIRTDQSYFKSLVSFFERRSRVGAISLIFLALAAGFSAFHQIALAQVPLATPLVAAVETPTVSVKLGAILEPLKGSTADVFVLTLEFETKNIAKVEWPDFSKIFAEQDLRVVRVSENTPTERDGLWRRGLKAEIAVDLPGTYEIPKLSVKVEGANFESTPISFDVISVVAGKNTSASSAGGDASAAEKKADILDIKPIIEERWPWRWLVVASGVALLILAVIAFLIWKAVRRGKRKKENITEKAVNVHEKALESLRKLNVPVMQSMNPEQRIKTASEFHGALGAVFRSYLEDRFLIRATDMTSEELWPQVMNSAALREKIGTDTVSSLKNFLFAADFVKFARAGANEVSLQQARDFVRAIVVQVRDKDFEAAHALQKEPWRTEGGQK
jgi:Mg-chelatase subunit ChlD